MGLYGKTMRSYLDILTGNFMIRQLQPWYENIGKRQVKAPKIYFRDSGSFRNSGSTDTKLITSSRGKFSAASNGECLSAIAVWRALAISVQQRYVYNNPFLTIDKDSLCR